jgi:glycosyltransferase involved in cell wall biosynthesis
MSRSAHVVGFINTSASWGGGEKWHFEAACFLQEQGYEVIFFCEPDSKIYQQLKQSNIRTEALAVSNLSFLNLVKLLRLKNRFRQLNIKSLLLNSPADVKLAAPAAKFAGVEKIIFRRGMPHPIRNNALNRWLVRTALTHVIANSQSVANTLGVNTGGIVPTEIIHVIENGMHFDESGNCTPLAEPIPDCICLSTAGRMVRQKNQSFLLKVAARLRDQQLNFRLIIAGTGELEAQLKAETSALNLNSAVLFPGFVTEMATLFNSTDIFLFPSLYEGSPNTLIEAAGAGLPIIATDIPANREILADHSLGRLVTPGDTDGFCQAIQELAGNTSLRHSIGAQAKTEVRRRFDLDKVRRKLLELLESP